MYPSWTFPPENSSWSSRAVGQATCSWVWGDCAGLSSTVIFARVSKQNWLIWWLGDMDWHFDQHAQCNLEQGVWIVPRSQDLPIWPIPSSDFAICSDLSQYHGVTNHQLLLMMITFFIKIGISTMAHLINTWLSRYCHRWWKQIQCVYTLYNIYFIYIYHPHVTQKYISILVHISWW